MIRLFILHVLIILLTSSAFPCTTAIISGSATADGRPVLWKHRDSSDELSAVVYFEDGLYDHIGLVNASDSSRSQVWIGYNSAGFAIMNSASYNLKTDADTTRIKDREGFVMKRALQVCTTLEDFATLLDTLPRPLGVEANFGVIDAQGGAAYFETDNFTYRKIDVNDPSHAPNGYIIRTNYSFTGNPERGYGYIRFRTAETLFAEAFQDGRLSWQFLIQDVSRSLKHSLLGTDLRNQLPQNADEDFFVHFQDYIPRHSSSSSIAVQGVKKRMDPELTMMWAVVGFPLTSVVLPCWLNAQKIVPAILAPEEDGASPLSKMAWEMKSACFPVNRGSGYKYLNVPVLLNRNETGIMQRLATLEEDIIRRSMEVCADPDESAVVKKRPDAFYGELSRLVIDSFHKLPRYDNRLKK